jgi:ParB/RepB/Spo0J family partition protein
MTPKAPTQLQTPEDFEASFAQRRRRPASVAKPTPTPHQAAVVTGFDLSVVSPVPKASPSSQFAEVDSPSLPVDLDIRDHFRYLDRSELTTLPDQPRSQANVRTHLQDLVESIRSLGIQTPLQVWWNPELQQYQVYDGHRRLAAIDELSIQNPNIARHIPVVILTREQTTALKDVPDSDRLFVLSLTINATRADLSKADRGRAYRRLLEQFGGTGAARLCGVSRQAIYKAIQAAEDADRHQLNDNAPYDRPAWTQKQWFVAAEAMVKQSTRLEVEQRTMTADWLRRLAEAIVNGSARVPEFEIRSPSPSS